MQAVILAAGMGTRLGRFCKTSPKGLIKIGRKSLLEYSFDALNEYGIKEVIIVVGFLQEKIKRKFHCEYKGLKITYVSNTAYYKTGSMYSFSKARSSIGSNDILLLEADLLYDPKALECALSSKVKNLILIAGLSKSGDEVYVCVDQNRQVTELGKNISEKEKNNAIGEFVGISKFSNAFLDKLFKKAEKDYNKGALNYDYEECVFATSKLGYPVYAVFCENLTWIEIDTYDNLKIARKQIYPRVKKLLTK